jgi:hypothetical protein
MWHYGVAICDSFEPFEAQGMAQDKCRLSNAAGLRGDRVSRYGTFAVGEYLFAGRLGGGEPATELVIVERRAGGVCE